MPDEQCELDHLASKNKVERSLRGENNAVFGQGFGS